MDQVMLRALMMLIAWMVAQSALLAGGPATQPASQPQPTSQPIQLQTFSSQQYRLTPQAGPFCNTR
jgi:hypothetical protein